MRPTTVEERATLTVTIAQRLKELGEGESLACGFGIAIYLAVWLGFSRDKFVKVATDLWDAHHKE